MSNNPTFIFKHKTEKKLFKVLFDFPKAKRLLII
jgi:uncharacterized membrane protein YsdA (DUF1294 family)